MESENLYLTRQRKLAAALQNASFDALVLNPGPSLKYLTGLEFHLSERPVAAILKPNEPVVLVLPELELAKTNQPRFPLQTYPYGENPSTWNGVFKQALQAAKIIRKSRVGIEPRSLRILEFQLIQSSYPQAEFRSAETELADLRMRKDEGELSAIRKAVDIAQVALRATLPLISIGMTERELASELVLQLFRAGSDPNLPFFPIVSSGPNSANPHASPTDRRLAAGDLLVIDWGASCLGYCSDITRTFALGAPTSEESRIAEIVLQANTAGRVAAQPGYPASRVDLAARSVIELAGYGKFFTHRTGHGLGMEGHEPPYIRSDNMLELKPGMVFTIEPGIYLPGRNGVRIEDNVVITETGSACLTDLPRELMVIPS